jgi:hypothetical protein
LEPRRQHYLAEETLSFRGQNKAFTFKRGIPNPMVANLGEEMSILPGVYRQPGQYSFELAPVERRVTHLIQRVLPIARSHNPFPFDPIRVEQHYGTQTKGLDITFDIETAIFFATHVLKKDTKRRFYYEKIKDGQHTGVIYAFRFTCPPVKKSEYLIKDFDIFDALPPERILRQHCGLPFISDEERNIAITDLDCIMLLQPDYVADKTLDPEHLFPNIRQDRFYDQLLQLKDRYPDQLRDVVEYRWAR